MPGIIGCVKDTGTREEIRKGVTTLGNGVSQVIYDPIFEDDEILSTRCHLGILGPKISPYAYNGCFLWLEGEFYNIKKIQTQFSLSAVTETSILMEAKEKGILSEVLSNLDGYFVAVFYDPYNQRIQFISDRFGMKPLYIWSESNKLAWSSEIKGFFQLKLFPKKINKEALLCFLDIGQLLGKDTYFKEVQLISPASILTYDLQNKTFCTQNYYWTWQEIQPIKRSKRDSIEEFKFLLEESVLSRYKGRLRHCVPISGGLDSRAILSVLEKKEKDINAYTFGVENSYEINIAKKVMGLTRWPHKIFNINDQNWLEGRVEEIWRNDGMINFIHLHLACYSHGLSSFFDVGLSGWGGGILLGGRWLENSNTSKTSILEKRYGKFVDRINYDDEYFLIEQQNTQYHLINRLRRFTLQGHLGLKDVEFRLPFLYNSLIEFLFSLPESSRRFGKLFEQSLVEYSPNFFSTIPYSNIRLSIDKRQRGYYASWVLNKIESLLLKMKIINRDYRNMHYTEWLEGSEQILRNVILSNHSIIGDFIDSELLSEKSLKSQNVLFQRIFTLEVYFQQVFNNKLRSSFELTGR